MSQYLVQITLNYLVSRSKTIAFMWGPYLVHKRILVIDKQIEHAVDYFSKSLNKSGCSYGSEAETLDLLYSNRANLWCSSTSFYSKLCNQSTKVRFPQLQKRRDCNHDTVRGNPSKTSKNHNKRSGKHHEKS